MKAHMDLAANDTGDRFVSIQDVLALTSIRSRSTIYSLIKAKEFPAPHPITETRRAWSYQEIQNWIADRKRHRAAA
jgi:predicted DNA-binding transcriptional regulator AlpA